MGFKQISIQIIYNNLIRQQTSRFLYLLLLLHFHFLVNFFLLHLRHLLLLLFHCLLLCLLVLRLRIIVQLLLLQLLHYLVHQILVPFHLLLLIHHVRQPPLNLVLHLLSKFIRWLSLTYLYLHQKVIQSGSHSAFIRQVSRYLSFVLSNSSSYK